MQLGYIGLGKMGAGMVQLLLEKKYRPVVYDVNAKAVRKLVKKGATGAESVAAVAQMLQGKPRFIWIMVPYHFVDSVIDELLPHLRRGDVIIDGGNSPYKESIKRGARLNKKGIHFLDVGVSGGPDGARRGACMMVGGSKKIYAKHEKLFRDLCVKNGYGYMGKSGAGHFVKMVHNGIEYGMMEAIVEGFDIMKKDRRFDLDLPDIARVYNHGSVVTSSLMGWLHGGFKKFGKNLDSVSGTATGSGEGRWTDDVAHYLKVPHGVIHESIQARLRTQKKPSFQGKMLMAIRNGFGGHPIKKLKKKFGTKEVL